MSHLQFQVKIPHERIAVFEEMLGDTIESLWWDEEGNITGIISQEKKVEFQNRFQSLFSQDNQRLPEMQFAEMDNRDWLEEDQQLLQPTEVENFFLYPPHYVGEIPQGKISFKIDSPHAFGSGHHETTKSCLLALHELSKDFKISNALDVGCGSGILAMAIASLWNVPVYATDIDAKSVETTLQNIEENGLEDIHVVESQGLDHEFISAQAPFDLIVANIHSEPLKELSPIIMRSITGRGKVVLSGILNEQEEDVVEVYSNHGFKLMKRYPEGQWSTLLFTVKI